MQDYAEEKAREYGGVGGSERDSDMKEIEGSGRHRRKGMLVARSDSINSAGGRRLFYGSTHGGDGHNQSRGNYDKERLGIGSSSKKRASRPSIFYLLCSCADFVFYFM